MEGYIAGVLILALVSTVLVAGVKIYERHKDHQLKLFTKRGNAH